MEEYYRDEKRKYTIIPAPEMPTDAADVYWGIGPYAYVKDGLLIYQVISAFLPIKIQPHVKDYSEFGFDNSGFVIYLVQVCKGGSCHPVSPTTQMLKLFVYWTYSRVT